MIKTIENKERAIELWAREVERCKTQELSQETAERFIITSLNRGKIDQDGELIADLENKHFGVGSAFWLRVKHLHTYSITPSLALFLATEILDNFGKSTMMAAYLQYIAWKYGLKTIGITEWAMRAFPLGIPTEEEWQRLWNAQKVPVEERTGWGTDNILDNPSVYGKSIVEIVER